MTDGGRDECGVKRSGKIDADLVRREVCETVMRLVFVVEKDRGLLNHGPRLPKITEGRW